MLMPKLAAATLLLFFAPAQTPQSSEDFIASRRGELTQYGKLLFRIDLSDSHWMRRTLQGCASFPHQAFVVYERAIPTGTDRFLVIYNLNSPPAKSEDRPWQGGISAIPLDSGWGSANGARPDEALLMTLFNRVLAEERRSALQTSKLQASQPIAWCFLSLAGEEALPSTDHSVKREDEDANLPLSGIIVPVRSSGRLKRFQVLSFDRRGFLEAASIASAAE